MIIIEFRIKYLVNILIYIYDLRKSYLNPLNTTKHFRFVSAYSLLITRRYIVDESLMDHKDI